jgi:hypothetical protein
MREVLDVAAIDGRTPHFTAVSLLDLPEHRTRPALAALVRGAEQHMRAMPGFVSASVLCRRSPAPEPGVDGARARLLQYVQWDSPAAYHRFLHAAGAGEVHSAISGLSVCSQTDTYELDAVIGEARRLDIIALDPRLTLVVVMEPRAGEQKFINEYNQTETRSFFSGFDGFVGVAFHLAASGRVLEYLQWESLRAMEAVNSTERFHAHIETNARHCQSIDFGIYDVMRTSHAREPLPGRCAAEPRGVS